MTAPITRGNIVRGVIIGTLVIALGLMIGTNMCGLHTQAAEAAGFAFPKAPRRFPAFAMVPTR